MQRNCHSFIIVTLATFLKWIPAVWGADAEPGFKSMFNGKDLAGWEGKPGWWSVADGAITAESTPAKPCDQAHYLMWRGGKPGDFELRLEYRLVGGNSGIQFRSRELPDWDTSGYQADMEAGNQWTGCLFEHTRGGVSMRGQNVVIHPDGQKQITPIGDPKVLLRHVKPNDWNQYRIVARGSDLTLEINGAVMCQATDRQSSVAARDGVIALQMHPGPPMKVQFRNLRIQIFDRPETKQDWPEFRGPRGDGHVSASGDTQPIGLPLGWSETNNVKWKTEIPYRGWSTPVVMGGQVWLTTATEDGHDFFAIGVDAETGRILFNEKLFHSENPESLGNGAGMNSYATPSPVIEPGRIYVHFGSFGTACLDTATGKVVWKRDDLPCRHYRGPASSLVRFENLLILTMDGVDVQYHVALDKTTGQTVWKTDRSVAWNDEDVPGQMAKDGDLRKAHSTPLIATVAGKPQMFSAGAKAAYAYDPRTGRELWKVQYPDWSVAPRPLYHEGLVFFVTGLSKKELWAVKTDGHGDVTDTHVAWKLKTRVGKYASPILVDGLIYTVADESFVTCLDAGTGDTVWTERIGGKYAASPVYAEGRLYLFDQQGTTLVLKPGRALDVLATNTLASGFMASPAVSGKAFYLRTRTHLYRIESPTPEGK